MRKNLVRIMAPLAVLGCCIIQGYAQDQASVSLEGPCEYAERFDTTTPNAADRRPWNRFRVPSSFSSVQSFRRSSGTLTLRWIIPRSVCDIAKHGGSIALRTGRAGDRARFFVNGFPVCSTGTERPYVVETDREAICTVPSFCFRTDSSNWLYAVYDFTDNVDFHGVRIAGSIGDVQSVYRSYYTEMIVSFFTLGCFLVIAFYYIILGVLRIRDAYNLYFGMVTLSFFFFMSANTIAREVFYLHNSILEQKVDLCSGISVTIFLILFITHLISARMNKVAIGSTAVLAVLALLSAVTDSAAMHTLRTLWYLTWIFLIPYSLTFTVVRAVRGALEARVLFAALLIFILCGVHDIFSFIGTLPFAFTTPYAFILFIIVMTILLAQKFVSVHNRMEELNAVLEQRVESRTAELELSNKQKDRMIGVIAHDLNNPITAINVTSSLMDISVKNMEYKSLAEYTAIIKQACTQAMNTIADVLRQARQRETDALLPGQTVDLVDLLTSLYRQYRVRAGEKDVSMVYNENLPPVFARISTTGFIRVMDNILSNALKFTRENDRIEMTVSAAGSKALVSVKDTGIGIPDEIKNTVFERFTPAGRQGTGREKSTGLGLSIARDIVEKHNGRIWFESIKGQGTTFFVEIPRIEPDPPASLVDCLN